PAWRALEGAFPRRVWDEAAAVMRKVMKSLAQHPGRVVPATELARAIYGNAKGHQLAEAMGPSGRRCQNRYGGAKTFSVKWNPVENRWEYTMPADVAARIARF